jgi:hypothetical protein
MLTRENNELICRVSPDTAMGKALRRYWLPVLQTSDYHRGISTLSARNPRRQIRRVPQYGRVVASGHLIKRVICDKSKWR